MSSDSIGDPAGGAQDVRRFSTRHDASSKNPHCVANRRIGLDLSVFFRSFLFEKKGARAQRGSP
jgi:hypothetical protein